MERFNYFKKNKLFDKKNFVKDSQWILLDRNTVKFFITYNFLNFYNSNFFAVDEHYFGNLCIKYNIPYKNSAITYVNWNENRSENEDLFRPHTYDNLDNETIYDIKNRKNQSYFFIRKISNDCILPSYYDDF